MSRTHITAVITHKCTSQLSHSLGFKVQTICLLRSIKHNSKAHWMPHRNAPQRIQCKHCHLITGSIARSATRRYLNYSEADFEVFRPVGATRCTDGGEIWHGGVDLRAKFHPHRCNNKGIGHPKLKFLLRCDQNVEYKRPAGAYPLRDFYKIC